MTVIHCPENFHSFLESKLYNLKDIDEEELCVYSFSKPNENDSDIISFLQEIKQLIDTDYYIIIKNFGENKKNLILLIKLIGEKIFYSKRLGYVDLFETRPFCSELSETLKAGGFHTDFSSMDSPPKYVALQCVRPDPKHPYFGRNQVARVDKILLKLENMLPGISEKLLNMYIPIKYNENNLKWIKLIELKNNQYAMKIHTLLVDKNSLIPEHFFDDIPIQDLLHEVALEVSDDFALDIGDVLIFSNEFCLHRRGEASVVFGETMTEWTGRIINSVRFY